MNVKSALLMFLSICTYGLIFAHGAEHTTEATPAPQPKQAVVSNDEIAQTYQVKVRPIFTEKCADCHGTGRNLPWYAGIFGIKQLIQWDIKQAKKHLDISHDYPFRGHGTPKEDLEAIIKSVKKQNMPPLRYKMLHWESGMTEAEKTTVTHWAQTALTQLSSTH